jgi:hypothetical protein
MEPLAAVKPNRRVYWRLGKVKVDMDCGCCPWIWFLTPLDLKQTWKGDKWLKNSVNYVATKLAG